MHINRPKDRIRALVLLGGYFSFMALVILPAALFTDGPAFSLLIVGPMGVGALALASWRSRSNAISVRIGVIVLASASLLYAAGTGYAAFAETALAPRLVLTLLGIALGSVALFLLWDGLAPLDD